MYTNVCISLYTNNSFVYVYHIRVCMYVNIDKCICTHVYMNKFDHTTH